MVAMIAEAPELAMPNEPKTKTVRCLSDVVMMLDVLKAAASIEGRRFSAVEYLDALIRKPLTADYKKALATISKQRAE